MHFSIKGRITKIDGEWLAEINHLNIRMKGPTPFKSIKAVADYISGQLDEPNNKCLIQIEDGVFYLYTAHPRPLIKFIAYRLSENIKQLNPKYLKDWFRA